MGAVAVALAGFVLFGTDGSYQVKARFLNAGQLVKGNPVQVGGVPVGSVEGIRITDDGQAEIELSIDEQHTPLRRGTRAERQTNADKRLPCLRQPPSLYDGRRFPYPRRGEAPLRQSPRGNEGSPPAGDPDPAR